MRNVILASLFILLGAKLLAINPPSAVGTSANLILWLHPDSAVYNSGGTLATIGQDVAEWRDISGNGFNFTNTYTNRRPVLTTYNSKRYLDFTSGDFFQNTAIQDSINGLSEFSIFITIKSDVTNTDKGFMDSEDPNGTDNKLCLRYDKSGANTGRTNLLKTGLNGNSSVNQVETQSNTQSTSLQTLTLVWEDGERLLVYINGVLNDSSSSTIAAPLAGINKIILGKGPKDSGGGLGGGSGWDGLIGEVVFYKKKYSADTIQQVASQISSIQSVVSGPWNSGTTWDCGCVPLDTYDITINTGHTVTLAGNSGARSLTVSSGGSLDLSAADYSLTVSEHFNMLGSLNPREGTISFTGDQPSLSTGSYSAHNLEINKTSATMTVQSGSISITNELQVTAGTFNPNSKTILLSTASQTARIAEVTGSISGSLTVQRYISGVGSTIGYRHFSTPFSNSTLNSFQYNASTNPGGVYTFGFTGSNAPSAGGYNSTYSFSEATAVSNNDFNFGWTAATNSSAAIGFDNAYTFYSGGSTYPSYSISCTGEPNTGTQTITNLSYGGITNVNSGWHLIGNPYASSINWSLVSKTGVDAVAYVYEQSQGGYIASSLLPNIAILSSYQAFFIHVSSTTNSIQFQESNKSIIDADFVRSQKTQNRLRISAHNKSTGKKAIVALDFNEFASPNFDAQYDAYKISNPSDFPNFYFPVNKSELQVNTIAESDFNSPLPLNLTSSQTTTMEVWIEKAPEVKGCLILVDNKTGLFYTIEDSTHFSVKVDPNDTLISRFSVEIMNSISEKKISNETCYEWDNGSIELDFNNFSGSWLIKNKQKEIVSAGSDPNPLVENLKADYYTIEWTAAHCGTFEDYFFIAQPEEIKTKYEAPESIVVGEEISPNNISTGASDFKWFINSEQKSIDPFPTFTFEVIGEYELVLEGATSDCKKSFVNTLIVGPPDDPVFIGSKDESISQLWTSNGSVFWEGYPNVQSIEVFNTSGQRIEKLELRAGQKAIELKDLEHGAYIISILNDEKIQLGTVKLIK